MTYCPKYEVEVIMWCRGWLPVYKREHFQEDWNYDSSKDVYSDWLDGTWWTPWECAAAATPKIDPEVVCLSNDGWVTTVTGWEVFDVSANPPTSTLYIWWVVAAAGFVVVPCDKDDKDLEIISTCFQEIGNPTNKYSRNTVIDTSTNPSTVVSTLWLDDNWLAVPAPAAATIEDCAITSVERIEQNLMPVDAVGNPVWTVVKEIRTYTNGVVATAYQDTVTGAVVALPAGTVQLVEEMDLQKEPMYMCDWGATTFIRHFVYNFGIRALLSFDTELDGTTPYIPAWVVTANACVLSTWATPTIVWHETLLTNWVIPAGKNSVSFVWIEGLNGTMTVNWSEIRTWESLTFSAYFNPVTNEYKSVPAIPYSVMAPSILRVNYID